MNAVSANEFHVAKTGSDQDPGTAQAPCLTVNKAAQQALPGDTVVIVYGAWLTYGEWHHRGAVYLDGVALSERRTLDEVRATSNTWFTASVEGKTLIWANFGHTDPNAALSEVNVRECVFFPEKTGLGFITLDGLVLMHSAENWAPPGSHQKGAVGANWGKGWTIQNCEIPFALAPPRHP